MSGATNRKQKAEPAKPADNPETTPSKGEVMLKDNPDRWKSWWVRTWWSLIMVGGFAFLIYYGGHFALVGLILFLQIFGMRELMEIRHSKLKLDQRLRNEPIPYYKFIDVLLFFSLVYFLYGSYFMSRFPDFFMANPFLNNLMVHHSFISFGFVIIGVVAFVLTLKRGFYKLQFKQLVWTTMALVAVAPSSFHVANIFNGLIWFLLPTSLIICNDITAFIWGFFRGRTPLISVSPKKTWEGFIGAFGSTVVFAFFFSWYLAKFSYFTCPKIDIFSHPTACPVSPLYVWTDYPLPELVIEILSKVGIHYSKITVMPVQLHAIAFGVFSSIIAPFGGFLASGFKRAFDIKDFGNVIPGHGGIVDRMDCQVVMSLFTYLYYVNFIQPQQTVETIIAAIASLPIENQLQIYAHLRHSLQIAGVV